MSRARALLLLTACLFGIILLVHRTPAARAAEADVKYRKSWLIPSVCTFCSWDNDKDYCTCTP